MYFKDVMIEKVPREKQKISDILLRDREVGTNRRIPASS
jgi:hypothetical protein